MASLFTATMYIITISLSCLVKPTIPLSISDSNDAISVLLSGGKYERPGPTVAPLCDTSFSQLLA